MPLLHSGKENDGLHRAHEPVQAKEMLLRDLGYWNMDYFAKVHQAQAYFLTRFKYGTKAIFIKNKPDNFIKIVLEDYIQKVLKSASNEMWEWDIYLGKAKLPVRLWI